MRRLVVLTLLSVTPMVQGCVASAVYDVATAPVRVASKGVDLATTSQSEADENRGREIRQREERLGKLQRLYEKQLDACQDGDKRACNEAVSTYAEIQQILPTVPAEPEN